jgi:hypothetical protein
MNANTYSSPGTTGGNREDLRGTLTILEPEETPLTSLVKKGPTPKSTLVEVLADTLRAARTTGSREGSVGAKGGNKAVKRQRFGSYLHRWFDTFGVTDVQQAITESGGNAVTSDEYADAKAKCIREVKRDIESVNCSANDGQGGSDDEMKGRGAYSWLASSQTPAVPSDFQPPAAQRVTGQAELNETGSNSLNSVLKSLKAKYGGSREYQMIAGNDYCEDVDLFTRINAGSTNTKYQVVEQAQSRKITLMVKVFESTFGRVNVIPSEFLKIDSSGVGKADTALILNMDLWEMLFLDEIHAMDEPEDAGGLNGYVKAIGGLFCRMPKGNAFIEN